MRFLRPHALALILAALAAPAFAQPAPNILPGCVYNATPPTLSDKQTTAWQCDSSGRLITSGAVVVLAQSSVESAVHTGDTNLTTLQTITVPANTLGANGRLRITALYRFTGTAGNKTTIITFGGTTFYSVAQTSTNLSWRGQIEIGNRNATNSQVSGASLAATFQAGAVDVTTGSVDTTASQNILLQGQLANGGDSIAVESYLVEVIK